MRLILLSIVLLLLSMGLLGQGFIENKGQWPEEVEFRVEASTARVYFEGDRILFDWTSPEDVLAYHQAHTAKDVLPPSSMTHHAYALEFIGHNKASWSGESVSEGTHNYFLGNDESKWGRNAHSFGQVRLESIYPGVDMLWYEYRDALKYDLLVAPGSDPSTITFRYQGVRARLDDAGRLELPTDFGSIIEAKPLCYQFIDGEKVIIPCHYVLDDDVLSFSLAEYDTSKELIIDPVLVFSSYSGSASNNFGYTATFDGDGFLYSGSTAFGNSYPTTLGAYDTSFNDGNVDIAISKYDTTGTFLVYSTYLGGSGDELPHSIIVNEQDELYVYGTSGSSNYPVTSEAYDIEFAGGSGISLGGLGMGYPSGCDIIISKLSFDGSDLIASTFVGGTRNDGINFTPQTRYNYADEIRGEIELDQEGRVLIASSTYNQQGANDFPTTSGAVQEIFNGGVQDGVVFRMDPHLTELQWSTYLGGSGADAAFSLALREDGRIVVTGGTSSSDLPTTPGVFQSFFAGTTDAWVAILDEDGTTIESCTYLGTADYDQAYFVELDSEGDVHLFGQTMNGDVFILNADYSVANSGQFITQLDQDLGGVVWSTAFGSGSGEPDISPTAFLVDVCNRIYLSGWGGPVQGQGLTTEGLEVTPDAYQDETDGGDFYLMTLTDDGSQLVYASYFGGDQSNEHVDGGTSRFDRKGKVYQSVCAGCQGNSDFPTFPSDVVSTDNGSPGCNNAVFKVDFELPAVIADFIYDPVCTPDTALFLNTSLGGLTFQWDFGDGEESSDTSPEHFYEEPGPYTVSLVVSDPLSCNLSDTLVQEIFIFSETELILDTLEVCEGISTPIGIAELPLPGITYSWDNGAFLDDPNSPDPIATVNATTTFTLTVDNGVCPTEVTQTIEVEAVELQLPPDTIICEGSSIQLIGDANGTAENFTWSDEPDFSYVLDTDSILEISPLFSSTYYLLAEGNCEEEGSVQVQLASDFISFSPAVSGCAEEVQSISVFHSQGSPLEVQWSPEELLVSENGVSIVDVLTDESVWMVASVTDESGCTYLDSIFVEISPLSFIQVEASASAGNIPLGESVQLFADPATGYSYQWSPTNGMIGSNSSNPTVTPSETTTYTVDVIDPGINGDCVRSDTVTIRVFEFLCDFPVTFIPNAFTPNGDGENDELFVRGRYLESIDLKIYDRWGNVVFATQDAEIGWDGTYEGKELDPAVYVYHLDVRCIDGQETFLKGNVTLIR